MPPVAPEKGLTDQAFPGAWLFAALVVAVLGAGAVISVLEARSAEAFMRDLTLGRTRMLARTIDRERLGRLTGTPADELSADYAYLREQIVSVRLADPRYRYIYLMGRNPAGPPFFYMGTAPRGSPDYSPPGQEYPEEAPALARAFSEKAEVVSEPVRDRWGAWISSLVPILDPATGRIMAIYGMDIDAGEWRGEVLRRALAPAASALFAATIVVILFLYLRSRQRVKAARGLEARNEDLEAKVRERTALLERTNKELLASNEGLAAALEQLKQTQDKLILSGRLAALGQLIAGIAHELNTPLGAVISANASLGTGLDQALAELPPLLSGLGEARAALFCRLVEEARAARPASADSAKVRARVRRVRAVLEAEGRSDAASLSEDLAALGRERGDAGIFTEVDRHGPGLIKAAVNLADLSRMQKVGAEAAGRAAQVVAALRKVSRQGPEEDLEAIGLVQEIGSLFPGAAPSGTSDSRH